MFILSIVIILCASIAGFIYWQQHRSVQLPDSVVRSVSFEILVPDSSWKLIAKPQSTSGVISYTVEKEGLSLAINQQALPDVFTEVPQYYPALLTKLHEYKTVKVPAGTAHLVRPVELNGAQSAVLTTDETLVFVRPSKHLSDSQWQDILQGLR